MLVIPPNTIATDGTEIPAGMYMFVRDQDGWGEWIDSNKQPVNLIVQLFLSEIARDKGLKEQYNFIRRVPPRPQPQPKPKRKYQKKSGIFTGWNPLRDE